MWDEADPPQCYTETFPKARKTHRCCKCSSNINIGEIYHKFTGIWDGNPGCYKTCMDCKEFRDKEAKKSHGMYEFGDLFTEIWHELDLMEEFVRIRNKRNVPIAPDTYERYLKMKEENEKRAN